MPGQNAQTVAKEARWSAAVRTSQVNVTVKNSRAKKFASPEKQIQFVEMGANLLIHKADAIFLSEGLQSQLGEIRSLLGQEGGPGGGSQVTI